MKKPKPTLPPDAPPGTDVGNLASNDRTTSSISQLLRCCCCARHGGVGSSARLRGDARAERTPNGCSSCRYELKPALCMYGSDNPLGVIESLQVHRTSIFFPYPILGLL